MYTTWLGIPNIAVVYHSTYSKLTVAFTFNRKDPGSCRYNLDDICRGNNAENGCLWQPTFNKEALFDNLRTFFRSPRVANLQSEHFLLQISKQKENIWATDLQGSISSTLKGSFFVQFFRHILSYTGFSKSVPSNGKWWKF